MSSLINRVYCVVVFCFAMSFASIAIAAPQGGKVVKGQGRIEQSGTHTDIYQNTSFMATRWSSFNIAAHESARAHQPNARSRLLIRVDGAGATNIAGSYTSNGITILENQNGVQFSEGAVVNVGGLLATSARLSGVEGSRWRLDGVGGAVVNHGTITAGAGGVVLAAVQVENTGEITSQGGDVAFGAGKVFTVNFVGSLVGFEVKQSASGVSILNEGKVEARGGIVKMTAQEAQNVRVNVISVGGVVKASRIKRRGGFVYLSGGDRGVASVSGKVKADKKVQTTGKYVSVERDAKIKAPKILVGGNYQGKGAVPTAARTFVAKDALLDAGQDGYVVVWSDEITWFYGNINAPGGFAEVSGKKHLAAVNFAGIHAGTLLLDPTNLIIGNFGREINGNIRENDPDLDDNTPIPAGDEYDYAYSFRANISFFTNRTFINVASINRLPTGTTLSLSATNDIVVLAPIDHARLNLTLQAGRIIWINEYISTGSGDLTLTAGESIQMHVDPSLATRNPAEWFSLSSRNITLNGRLLANRYIYPTIIRASGNVTITRDFFAREGIIDARGNIRIDGNLVSGGPEFILVSQTGDIIVEGDVQIGNQDTRLALLAAQGNIVISGTTRIGTYDYDDIPDPDPEDFRYLSGGELILAVRSGTVTVNDVFVGGVAAGERVSDGGIGFYTEDDNSALYIIAASEDSIIKRGNLFLVSPSGERTQFASFDNDVIGNVRLGEFAFNSLLRHVSGFSADNAEDDFLITALLQIFNQDEFAFFDEYGVDDVNVDVSLCLEEGSSDELGAVSSSIQQCQQ